ncbi:MAG: hypothetical protein AAFV88_01775 [Planctomycetota bacterium]
MRTLLQIVAVSLVFFCCEGKAVAKNFFTVGAAQFNNIQEALLFQGADSPYLGFGIGSLGGVFQSGAISPSTPPTPTATGITFDGIQGPNPLTGSSLHIINTRRGAVFCTWTATFDLDFVEDGKVVFRGDGQFTVVGGTGIYSNASGTFRTLFQTGEVDATTDSATAVVFQYGEINF